MKKPLLTICVLCHNSEKFIEKTLKSILSQAYSDSEIIISDNYSDDSTPEIIKHFQKDYPKIIYRRNEKPLLDDQDYIGCYENYNTCLKSGLINGEFVAFCHDDDIYHKDVFEKQINFLIKNPEAGAVFTMVNLINNNDKIIRTTRIPKILGKKNIHNFTEIFNALLYNGNTFLETPAFLARKKTFETSGFFNEDRFRTSADLEMWLRIAEKYSIGILDERLVDYRVGGGGRAYQRLRNKRSDFFSVMDYYLEKKSLAAENKFLRQYEYQKNFDDTLLALNFLMKDDITAAKKIINQPVKLSIFLAFFENITLKRMQVSMLRIIMFLGINAGFGKYLKKIFQTLIVINRR
ncbi:MAG: glycosyltransferase [Candidatus Staskawiczbacteria bacterium]|nr:glycosyltransferase [Candidatus Staskawiczbacteria bacterium]